MRNSLEYRCRVSRVNDDTEGGLHLWDTVAVPQLPPAARLEGLTLSSGWRVVERLPIQDGATGGLFFLPIPRGKGLAEGFSQSPGLFEGWRDREYKWG